MSDPFGFGKVDHAKDPVLAYGVAVGRLQRGVAEFFRRFAKGLEAGLAGAGDLTPKQREHTLEGLAALRCQQRIERERTVGLAYVHAQAARVRRELGLEESP